MIFSCGETEEVKTARLAEWHDFFVLWPKSIDVVDGEHRCVWLQTIERRGRRYKCYFSSGRMWFWDYRLKERRKNAKQNLPPRED